MEFSPSIHFDVLCLFILLVLTDGIYVGRCLIVRLNETLATTITKRQVAGQAISRPVTYLAIQIQVRRNSIQALLCFRDGSYKPSLDDYSDPE